MRTQKYIAYPKMDFPGRKWPDNSVTRAPKWCSVDLRDGNQALSVPMSVDKKLEYFRLLVKIGFKEIEVGFPASSETEYKFVRELIEGGHIPRDVAIQVLTPGRRPLIERTFEALKGVRSAIVNLYYPTSKVQRELVLRKTKTEIVGSIRECVGAIKYLAAGLKGSSVRL